MKWLGWSLIADSRRVRREYRSGSSPWAPSSIAPAVAEQIRLDPCSAYDTATALAATSANPGAVRAAEMGHATPPVAAPAPPRPSPPGSKRSTWRPLAGTACRGSCWPGSGWPKPATAATTAPVQRRRARTDAVHARHLRRLRRRRQRRRPHATSTTTPTAIFSAANYLVHSGVRSGTAGSDPGPVGLQPVRSATATTSSTTPGATPGRAGVVVCRRPASNASPSTGDLPGFNGIAAHLRARRPNTACRRPRCAGLRCVKAAFPAITSHGRTRRHGRSASLRPSQRAGGRLHDPEVEHPRSATPSAGKSPTGSRPTPKRCG